MGTPLARDVWDIMDGNATNHSHALTNTSASGVLVTFVERKCHQLYIVLYVLYNMVLHQLQQVIRHYRE